ncbi:MAG TPA: dihydroorotase [Thermodesulfobacteriaceae bacterium]|nr:dihydroorotase [Thermodesulfobacteriaceae bacterium]
MKTVLFKGGRIIDPSQDWDFAGDILVDRGVIRDAGPSVSVASEVPVIELAGMWFVPGLVDMHVHLREPGEEYKETIASGTAAAAAGGFTAVACMPNSRPPNDSAAITRLVLEKAGMAGNARVYPVAAVTMGQKGERITEFGDLLEAGAVAFSDDGVPVANAAVMRRALEYSRNFDALIISHAEEPDLAAGGVMNEGSMSTLLGLKGIPAVAEEIAVFRDVCLAELTGGRLHIAHVSTRGAVEIIRQAKQRGVRVTAETAPHYFSLTEEVVEGYNTLAKMNPPLRTEEDRSAIIEGLQDGILDAVATDHAPHSSLEKECEFQIAANGITGLETALPLTLALVRGGHMSASDMIRSMSTRPSEILGIPGGTLRTGGVADITIIDPDSRFELTRERMHSLSCNTPFLGQTLTGQAVLTMVGGRPVYDPRGLLLS